MIATLYFIFGSYLIFVGVLTFGIIRGNRIDTHRNAALDKTSLKGISILIPFYNGQNHIEYSIENMKKIQHTGLNLEFIYIDDYSTDSGSLTVKHEKDSRFTLLSSSALKGKKSALEEGVKAAKHEWILTTDIDCSLPYSIIEYYREILNINPKINLIAGPVLGKEQNFQSFNLLSLAVFSQASSNLGVFNTLSGANLMYRKRDFLKFQPYKDNLDLPSGDDMFLLKAFKKAGLKNLYFVSNPLNIVETQCLDNTEDFINQQLRWASKTNRIANPFHILSGFIVSLGNISTLILSLVFLVKGFFLGVTMIWLLKLIVDGLYFYSYRSVVKRQLSGAKYLKSSLIYPFFTSFVAVKIFLSPRNKVW